MTTRVHHPEIWKSNADARVEYIVVTSGGGRVFGPWPGTDEGYDRAVQFSMALLEDQGINSTVKHIADALIRSGSEPPEKP